MPASIPDPAPPADSTSLDRQPGQVTRAGPDGAAGRSSRGQEPRGGSLGSAALMAGVGVLMVLCCAGPALVAAGALGVLAAWLHNPALLGAAAGAAVATIAWLLARRQRPRRDACCPSDATSNPLARDPTSQTGAHDR